MNRYISKTVGNIIQILDTKNFNRVVETFDSRSEKGEAIDKLNDLNGNLPDYEDAEKWVNA